MKMDTSKNGLNRIWKLYEIATIEELLEHEERTSGEVMTALTRKSVKISRASVIIFLNRLVDEGLATFREESGKGGFHKVYKLIERTWDKFNNVVIDKLLYSIWEIFPENENIKKSM